MNTYENFTIAELALIAISREFENLELFKQMLGTYKDEQNAKRFEKILSMCDKDLLKSFIKNLYDQEIHVITRESKTYPYRLRNLENPPLVLYARGNLELLTKSAVAIIGTRKCTHYGEEVAKDFAKKFADKGIVVISGLADGIDTHAHLGAIKSFDLKQDKSPDSKILLHTIAVLGNGINTFYPASNTGLQQKITKYGLVLSEYLPNFSGAKFTFPQRNRIVAALSNALVIVEADLKSGTMITMKCAQDVGIDVYAVPGPITSYVSRGTNQLIKEGGAIATNAQDVLDAFGVYEKSPQRENAFIQLSFDEKQVLDTIGNKEVHFDGLIEEIGLPVHKLSTLLTNMEMSGLIKKLAGNYYKKT